jgi:hypothetical protein
MAAVEHAHEYLSSTRRLPQEVPLVLLGKHGQVEFALDAIIRSAEDGVVEMGSVSRSQTSSM